MITYEQVPAPVRTGFAESHQRFWDRLAARGTWWTGAERVAFAEAIVTGEETLVQSRAAVAETVGLEDMVDAAGVASNFERMVRIADSTGIELDDRLEQASAEVRYALGLERPAGR